MPALLGILIGITAGYTIINTIEVKHLKVQVAQLQETKISGWGNK